MSPPQSWKSAEAVAKLVSNEPKQNSTKTNAKSYSTNKMPLKKTIIKKTTPKSKRNRANKRLSKDIKEDGIRSLTSVRRPDNGCTISIEDNDKEIQENERSKQLALRDSVKEGEEKVETRLNLVQPTKSNPSTQYSMRTELPANWHTMHPVHLLSIMRSDAKYAYNVCTGTQGFTHQRTTIIVDQQEFTVCEVTNKLARRNVAALVCNSMFQTDFQMDGAPERKMLFGIHPSSITSRTLLAQLAKPTEEAVPAASATSVASMNLELSTDKESESAATSPTPVAPIINRGLPPNWESLCNMRGLHPSTRSAPVACKLTLPYVRINQRLNSVTELLKRLELNTEGTTSTPVTPPPTRTPLPGSWRKINPQT